MIHEEISTVHDAFKAIDVRELNPLQMAYVGDTVHDLYVRSMLLSRGMTVGKMHRQAVRMVSAGAQAKMLAAAATVRPSMLLPSMQILRIMPMQRVLRRCGAICICLVRRRDSMS